MHDRRASALVATLAVTLLLGIASCSAPATSPAAGLEAARARWAHLGPAAYTVTIARSCNCLPEMSGPVIVVVRNGTVTSRHYVQSGAAVGPQYAAVFPAVEGLFAIIDAGLREGVLPLDARYDAGLGYPIRIAVGDPNLDAPVYSVSELRPE
jgi:hypothetical protein